MVQEQDAGLIGYLADHYDQARLALRGASDADAGLAALRKAAAAMWDMPHPDAPDDPSMALPNWCRASLEEGIPVLHMDAGDGGAHIDEIAATLTSAVAAEAPGSRLVPHPRYEPPEDTGGRSDAPPPDSGAAEEAPSSEEVLTDLGLDVSVGGLLFQPGLRSNAAQLLSNDWSLVAYETCFAAHALTDILVHLRPRLREEFGREKQPMLWPLREHREGMTLAELCTRSHHSYEDLVPVFDELEKAGELVRWHSDDGLLMLRLTESGQRAMDEHQRRRSGVMLRLSGDIGPEQLVVMRHVCLQLMVNRERLEERAEDDSTVEAFSDERKWRPAREDGRLYAPGVRDLIGPSEPEALLGHETWAALSEATFAFPRTLPSDIRSLPLWWLHAAAEDGLSRSAIVDALGDRGSQVLDELEEHGAVTCEEEAEGADGVVLRLSDKGRELTSRRISRLDAELRGAFEGIGIDDLARTRDGCWRINLHLRRTVA